MEKVGCLQEKLAQSAHVWKDKKLSVHLNRVLPTGCPMFQIAHRAMWLSYNVDLIHAVQPIHAVCNVNVNVITYSVFITYISNNTCYVVDVVCNYEVGKGEDNCDVIPVPICDAGFIPVQNNVGECMPDYSCECNTERNPCPAPPACTDLEHVVEDEEGSGDGGCCPTYSCGQFYCTYFRLFPHNTVSRHWQNQNIPFSSM